MNIVDCCGLELIKEMSGHSGCRVLLYRSDDRYFIRKISASFDYNLRLDLQREKQRRLHAIVNTPEVLNQGVMNGLSYFDMAFVRGHDFSSYAPLQNVASLSELSHGILAPLNRLYHETGRGVVDEGRFHAKVSSVCASIRSHPLYEAHAAMLIPVLDHLAAADWSGIPASQCHGDFTLENLIITDSKELVLIDVLDGNLDSVWLDVAKMLHDLESGWSLRSMLWKRDLSAADRLIAMLSRYLYEEMRAEVDALFPGISGRLKQLRALQAARVLPYSHDEHIFWRVARGLDHLFQKGSR